LLCICYVKDALARLLWALNDESCKEDAFGNVVTHAEQMRCSTIQVLVDSIEQALLLLMTLPSMSPEMYLAVIGEATRFLP
jgi:hypothetical protein